MIKDLDSPYTPGKRGKSWLKMKRELATLDVVVTAVEYGHGKRDRRAQRLHLCRVGSRIKTGW